MEVAVRREDGAGQGELDLGGIGARGQCEIEFESAGAAVVDEIDAGVELAGAGGGEGRQVLPPGGAVAAAEIVQEGGGEGLPA